MITILRLERSKLRKKRINLLLQRTNAWLHE